MFIFFHSRTCVPAEVEPLLNSSECYPLVNFSRPFCQNHGVILSDNIYETPYQQSWYNNYANEQLDKYVRFGVRKMSRLVKVANETVITCVHALLPVLCHNYFPSCEASRGEYKQQKICRETCLNLIRICGKMGEFLAKVYTHIHPEPESKKRVRCKLLPYRNAGDSPECWYSDLENSTGNIKGRRLRSSGGCNPHQNCQRVR